MTEVASATGNDWQEAAIVSITMQTPTVTSFVLRPERWRPFLPGQHIDVRLTAADGYRARRSYSITSAPLLATTCELAIERLNDGEISTWFHDQAAVGDVIEISGPFAEHFVWRPAVDESVLLIGGGSGVAPLMAMLRHRAMIADPPPMLLLYAARSWNDVMYRNDLLTLERTQRSVRCVFALTRDVAHRATDYARRIDAEMLSDILGASGELPHTSFVCGNNSFVSTVAQLLVARGIVASSIRTERYGGAE